VAAPPAPPDRSDRPTGAALDGEYDDVKVKVGRCRLTPG